MIRLCVEIDFYYCMFSGVRWAPQITHAPWPQWMGTDSPASRSPMRCLVTVSGAQKDSMEAWLHGLWLTSKRRNRPRREWEESSAPVAPFGDHRNWSHGFVRVILTDSPSKMKASQSRARDWRWQQANPCGLLLLHLLAALHIFWMPSKNHSAAANASSNLNL